MQSRTSIHHCGGAFIIAKILLLCSLYPLATFAVPTWIPLTSTPTQAPPPEVRLLSCDYSAIHIQIELAGFYLETTPTEAGDFSSLSLAGEGFTTSLGSPRLPVIRRLIEIPYGAIPKVTVKSVVAEDLSLADLGINYRLIPVQPFAEKRPGSTEKQPFVFDEAAYNQPGFSEGPVARLTAGGYLRGHHLVMLEIIPFDYSPTNGRLRIHRNLEIQIDLPGADLAATRAAKSRLADYQTQMLAQRLLVNPVSYRETDLIPTPIGLLLITSPAYASLPLLQDFITWKEQKGFHVTVATTAQTGTTTTQIKAYLQNAYNTWFIPPNFVLLVGDVDVIPTWSGQMPVSPSTDLYYSTLEGDDLFPDVGLGRFSVANNEDLTNVINKILNYEQVLWTGNPWEKAAVFMASNDNWWITEATHDSVIGDYLEPDGYRSAKLYSHSFGATPAQVTQNINAGRSLVTYAGHGYFFCWLDGPLFTQHNVEALTNVYYPFVGSFACDTGQFMRVGECFGETWLRSPHGAIAYWGAAATSYWIPDDILERELFEGLFAEQMAQQDQNLTWIAGMTNYAKFAHWVQMGGNQMGHYYWELYNVLGDPSLDVWTDVPQNLTVTFPATVLMGQTSLSVQVNGYPDWAMVNVYSDAEDLQFTDYVTNGSVTLNLGSGFTVPGTLHIWVTGHDCRPYHGTAAIIPASILNAIDNDAVGGTRSVASSGDMTEHVPPRISPNPFNPTTAINFELRTASFVNLKIYDTAGRLVATLADGWREAGGHQATFDGAGLPSGIYFAKLTAGEQTAVQKLVLMK